MADFTIKGGVLAFAAAPDFESPADADTDNVYQVTVEANDGTYMDTQDVTVTVTNVDETGEVTLSTTEPRAGTELTASVMDPDGGVTGETWQWAREDVVSGRYGDIPNANSASYTPVEADVGQHLWVTVNYTDAIGSKDLRKRSDSPVAGLAINGPSSSSYAENDTDAVGTYIASGPNAAMATWSLSGADAGDFNIEGGELAFAAAPDFESPADADTDNVYQVTVEAYDGTYMDTQVVTVEVTDVDEAPDVAGEASIGYPENGTGAVATYTAVDPEDAEIVWSRGGDDGALFSIEGGVLAFAAAPDFESPADMGGDNVYQVTVGAYDGTYIVTQEVTVTVTDVDEAPDVTGEASIGYPENGTGAVATYTALDPEDAEIVWSRGGDDGALFSIEGGVLAFAAAPDFESPADMGGDNVYQVTVGAYDGTYIVTQEVTVTVTDVDEAPDVTGEASIGYPENGTGAVATYTALDPEDAEIVWSLGGDDGALFSIEGGVLAFAAAPDFESPADMGGDNVYQVTVEAYDGTYMVTQDVTVTVTDVEDDVVTPGDSVVDLYDTDDNGRIDKDELSNGVFDYNVEHDA